jgi:hypothetical protein
MLSDKLLHMSLKFSRFVFAFHDISPERPAEFVGSIYPFQAVHLAELVERSKAQIHCRLFAITVDDGVGQNVRLLSGSFPGRGRLPSISHQYLDSGSMVFQWRGG